MLGMSHLACLDYCRRHKINSLIVVSVYLRSSGLDNIRELKTMSIKVIKIITILIISTISHLHILLEHDPFKYIVQECS